MVVDDKPVNPLIESIHEQRIDRPDSIRRKNIGRSEHGTGALKRDWHPIAATVAMLGSLLCQKGHSWNKGQKKMYKRAIEAARHPCCPSCGKPMAESAVTHEGKVHKSWWCTEHPNF